MPLPLGRTRKGFSPQPEPAHRLSSSSCRSQLEQDVSPFLPPFLAYFDLRSRLTRVLVHLRSPQVKKLQKTLQEETALHSVLEGALERAAVTLADMAYLPTNVRTLPLRRRRRGAG